MNSKHSDSCEAHGQQQCIGCEVCFSIKGNWCITPHEVTYIYIPCFYTFTLAVNSSGVCFTLSGAQTDLYSVIIKYITVANWD